MSLSEMFRRLPSERSICVSNFKTFSYNAKEARKKSLKKYFSFFYLKESEFTFEKRIQCAQFCGNCWGPRAPKDSDWPAQ